MIPEVVGNCQHLVVAHNMGILNRSIKREDLYNEPEPEYEFPRKNGGKGRGTEEVFVSTPGGDIAARIDEIFRGQTFTSGGGGGWFSPG